MQWEGVPESVRELVNGNTGIFFLSVFHYGGKGCHYSGQLCTLYKPCGVCTRTHPYMQPPHLPPPNPRRIRVLVLTVPLSGPFSRPGRVFISLELLGSAEGLL